MRAPHGPELGREHRTAVRKTTFTVAIPGGLPPGAPIDVAFTFAIVTHGTFWFGYDVDAATGTAPDSHSAGQSVQISPHATRRAKPGDSGRIR